jgi:hypothetical protein
METKPGMNRRGAEDAESTEKGKKIMTDAFQILISLPLCVLCILCASAVLPGFKKGAHH